MAILNPAVRKVVTPPKPNPIGTAPVTQPKITPYAAPKPAPTPIKSPVTTTPVHPAITPQSVPKPPVDPTTLTGADERAWRAQNPTADYTKSVDMRNINQVGTMLKNNAGVSADQLKAYQTNLAKWNMQDPNANAPDVPQSNTTQPEVFQPDIPQPFNFNYNYMNYDTAKGQAEQQFNPLYEQAVKNLQGQEYQNKMNSGEEAASRGIAQSGLASDALNKIAIATQNNVSDLNAKKMSDVSALAQQMMQQDQQRGDSLYSRAYQQYRDTIGDKNYANETAYSHSRDALGDQHYNSETAYNHSRDALGDQHYNDETAYNHGRDALGDQHYNSETTYNHGQDAIHNNQTQTQINNSQANNTRDYNRGVLESDRQWNQMSPAEKQKATMDLINQQSLVNSRAAVKSTGSSGSVKSGSGKSSSKGQSGKGYTSTANSGKPMSKTNSYNEGITYWSGLKKDLKSQGAAVVERNILSDPKTLQEIRKNGYDINSFIDSMYMVASDGQFKTKDDYNKFVKSLKE